MQVKVHVYYQNKDGLTYKKTLSYVNPDVSDENLMSFINGLSKLTTDKLGSVYKVINDFLENVKPDPDAISKADVDKIISGDYIVIPDDDGVTVEDIAEIFGGEFVPIDDPDGITQADIDKIFNKE